MVDPRSLSGFDPRDIDITPEAMAADRWRRDLEEGRLLRSVFLTQEGAKVLEALRDRFRRPPGYRPGSSADALYAVYRDGQRSVIDEIERIMARPEVPAQTNHNTQGRPQGRPQSQEPHDGRT